MRSATLLAIVALALGACTESTVAPTQSLLSDRPSLDDGVSLQLQPTPGLYTWSQGNPATYMGSSTGGHGLQRVCYLTRISGRFAGWSEEVRVYLVGTSWYLGGSSNSVGVDARARCFLALSFSGEDTWWEPLNPIVLNKGSEWACFLTGVQGELAGTHSTNNDGVNVQYHSNGWILDGRGTGGTSSQLRARSRCAKPVSGNSPGNFGVAAWMMGWDATSTHNPTTTHVCTLNNIFGAFNQASSYVQITAGQTYWTLNGGNVGSSAGVTTHCFKK